ncbi:MAG: pantetheine-phosphate adenylyltransferase [Defluviitaleaceae bacterium]|nr:pantetheine-phosphate adenylyltransferase [Defluviitaleaceae bacterium]
MTAIYPGSFDPVTNGHIDIIRRALCFADHVVVGVVSQNVYKKGMFTQEERVGLLREALSGVDGSERMEIREFSGLLAEFFDECGADVVVRGIRSPIEYEYDLAQTLANRQMNPRLETIFLPANPAHVFLSSSIVKEIAAFGGDIGAMVPDCVQSAMRNKRQ